MIITLRAKEGVVVEQNGATGESQYPMDEDEMTISQFSLSRRSSTLSLSSIKRQRKPIRTLKRTTHKTKQVTSYAMGKSARSKRKKSMENNFYEHFKAKSPIMERAEEIQANLAAEFPSFIMTMLRSHVTCGFWMKLPREFCYLHLPSHNTTVTVVSNTGEEYMVKFLVGRFALSGGWRRFSVAHELLEGDVLVFQLVEPLKFKVYAVRASELAETDAALGLLYLNACANQMNSTEGIDTGLDTSKSFLDFKEVRSIEDFSIFVNGSAIVSELSAYHRTKYYERCCAQNSFLHHHLLNSISCKFAAEIITETINIADAIKHCELCASPAEYSTWDTTLEGFELLGMNVGFLRAELSRVSSLDIRLQKPVKLKRYREARLERANAEEEMNALRPKLLPDLNKTAEELVTEMETLEVNAERN